MSKVLTGIRVLDFSRYAAGPSATMILADMGADVIRVEPPGGGEDRTLGPFAPNGESLPFGIIINRNKRGITLNLRSESGQSILKKLAAKADVVVENFSPGVKAEMGMTYEGLKAINPRIIHVSVTAYGQNGPYVNRLGFDPIAQAMCSAMSYSGFPGNPPVRFQASWVDNSTGIATALGTVLALYHRQATGEGQAVDMALLDTAISFVSNMGVAAEYKVNNFIRSQIGNGSFYAYGDCFQVKDGWVYMSVIGDSLWRRLCRLLGREDWLKDERFSSDLNRFQNRQTISDVIAPWVASKTVAETLDITEKNRIPCAPVSTVPQMVANPQVAAREMLVDVDFPGVGPVPHTGVAIKLSKTPGSIEHRAPLLGEHNEEIYCGLLGMKKNELTKLKAEGVI